MDTTSSSHSIEWGVAQKALPGETVSGDLHLVQPHARGVLLAVVDGIGHGREATNAAALAIETLRQRPAETVLLLLRRCHAALAQTRGVVMTLADFNSDEDTLTLSGVGNVEAVLFRAGTRAARPRETALLRGGTVGDQLPEPYASVLPVHPGDVLVMISDGLRNDFGSDFPLRGPAQRLADQILQKNFKGTDDALALVVRFRPEHHE